MAELVDALDLKSGSCSGSVGSIPTSPIGMLLVKEPSVSGMAYYRGRNALVLGGRYSP